MGRRQIGATWAGVFASLTLTLAGVGQTVSTSTTQTGSPQQVSLSEALRRAQVNEPALAAATAESRALALERKNARAAFLPTAVDHNQAIYTEPNGVPASRIGQTAGAPSPIFIANNAVREYALQAVVSETLGFQQIGAVRLADANAARALAEAEILRRGLVATVVLLYYQVNAAEEKLAITQRAQAEAASFLNMTRKREAAREVAHADVLKAQLQEQARGRDFDEARLASNKAKIELAVLLFPDPTTPFVIELDPASPALPDRAAVEVAASANNAELRSALASLGVSQAETYAAKAALLPELAVNVTYGIDATTVSSQQIDPEGSRINNLGYSGSATLDIPLWDWLTGVRKVKEARLRENASRVAITATQRRLLANLEEFYAEAQTSSHQLVSLENTARDAKESLRLTNLRYTDGESTALEVVDAENTLTLAESSLADGAVRYHVAIAQLQTLTGTL